MEVGTPTPAAPAQPVAPVVDTPAETSASVAAVEKQDFGAFRQAEKAERAGKPLQAVAVAPTEDEPPAGTAPVERQPSKRQQATNDAIRLAVDHATADLAAENAALRAKVAPAPAEPAKPVPVTLPEYKRLMALPDFPKLADYDSLEEHSAAVSLFALDQRDAQRAGKDADAKAVEAITKTITGFQEQIATAGGKAFMDSLSPEVGALRPVEALHANGEAAKVGPLNVLTSEIVKSAHAPQLLKHFSDHPEDLDRIAACRNVAEVYTEYGKVLARVDTPASASVVPKTLTSAPPPPTTFGTARSAAPADASSAAVQSGDFRAFRASERAKAQAQRA